MEMPIGTEKGNAEDKTLSTPPQGPHSRRPGALGRPLPQDLDTEGSFEKGSTFTVPTSARFSNQARAAVNGSDYTTARTSSKTRTLFTKASSTAASPPSVAH